jgi:two-component system LytT family response regulator
MRFSTQTIAAPDESGEFPRDTFDEARAFMRRRERLLLHTSDAIVAVHKDEVDWIGAAGRELEIHVKQESYRLRATIGAFLDVLDPQQFVQIHRSTIVNLDRVREVRAVTHGDFTLTLSDGAVLRGSRKHRSGIAAFCTGRHGAIPIGGRAKHALVR